MTRILVSPSTYRLSNRRYGKTYNLFSNVPEGSFGSIQIMVGTIKDDIENPVVDVHSLHSQNRLRYLIEAYQDIWRRMQRDEVDLYHHVNFSYLSTNPILLRKKQRCPVLIGPVQSGHAVPKQELGKLIEWSIGRDLSARTQEYLYRVAEWIKMVVQPTRYRLFKRTLQSADRIIAVNEATKREYAEHTDISKIDVISLGVDLSTFEYSDEREPGKMVTVGRLTERKRHIDLLKMMGSVADAFPESHLHVIGDGPLGGELRDRATALGVEKYVTFHGSVPQSMVLEHLQSAHAFVHPSHSEGFSHARLEAMATGCPVVGTDVLGADEMIRDGVDGFVVPRGSPPALAEAVERLLADRSLAEEMGRNARRQVEAEHDWADIGRRYREVYESMLSSQ